MSELTWAGVSLAEEDRRMSGVVKPGFDISGAKGWCDVIAHFVGAPLLAALNDPREPDWAPRAVRVKPSRPRDDATADKVMAALARQRPPAWESQRFSSAQADIVRSVWQQLSTGSLRAFGRRAGLGAPWEWIPRELWEQYPGIDHRYSFLPVPPAPPRRDSGPWAALFTNGVNAFLLDEGKAWCDVAVIESPRRRVNWQTHRQAEIDRQGAQQQTAANADADVSAEPAPPPGAGGKPPSSSKGGRPRGFDRQAFQDECRRYCAVNPGYSVAAMNAHMMRWECPATVRKPSPKWVRERTAEFRRAPN